jgi:hypothetical protein
VDLIRQAIGAASEIDNEYIRRSALTDALQAFRSQPARALELAVSIPAEADRDEVLNSRSEEWTEPKS